MTKLPKQPFCQMILYLNANIYQMMNSQPKTVVVLQMDVICEQLVIFKYYIKITNTVNISFVLQEECGAEPHSDE